MGPYDKAVHHLFAQPGVAGAFLREHLPKQVARRIAGEPELLPGTFIDESLRGHLADQVMRVRLHGQPTMHVYCLVEHKRTNDRFVLLQVLRYMVQVYSRAAKQKPSRLPPVAAIVLYNGSTPWNGATRFSDVVEIPRGLESLVVDFSVKLIDLSALPLAGLSKHRALRGGLMALKTAASPAAEQERTIEAALELLRDDEPSTLNTFVSYFQRIAPDALQAALSASVEKLAGGDQMRTIEEAILARGMRKGVRKGIEKGIEAQLRDAVRTVIGARFKKVPPTVLARIDKAPIASLRRWLVSASTARSLSAAFD